MWANVSKTFPFCYVVEKNRPYAVARTNFHFVRHWLFKRRGGERRGVGEVKKKRESDIQEKK